MTVLFSQSSSSLTVLHKFSKQGICSVTKILAEEQLQQATGALCCIGYMQLFAPVVSLKPPSQMHTVALHQLLLPYAAVRLIVEVPVGLQQTTKRSQ